MYNKLDWTLNTSVVYNFYYPCKCYPLEPTNWLVLVILYRWIISPYFTVSSNYPKVCEWVFLEVEGSRVVTIGCYAIVQSYTYSPKYQLFYGQEAMNKFWSKWYDKYLSWLEIFLKSVHTKFWETENEEAP